MCAYQKNGADYIKGLKATNNVDTLLSIRFEWNEALKIIKILVGVVKLDVDTKNRDGKTLLALFCDTLRSDAEDIINYLISHGADLESKDHEGFTPLLTAARNNKGNIAKLLIDKGADVNAKTNTNDVALHRACLYNNK